MRIAIACSGLGHIFRGNEAWASDLARSLSGRGEDVTLYKGAGEADAGYERVVRCARRASYGVTRLDRWLPRPGRWRLGLGSGFEIEQTTFAAGLLAGLRRDRADILHVPDPRTAVLMQRASRYGLIPSRVILAHETEEPLSFLSKVTYVNLIAKAHEEAARAAGAWKSTWSMIPNFIDTEVFRPDGGSAVRAELGIPPEARVVLTAAAIKRSHKRIDYLLGEVARLLASWPDSPVWLVVAGGREHDTDGLIDEGRARLGDRVRFLVDLPRRRMPELYRAADVFVLCSLKEMFGIVLLEAMASGVPCLVNDEPTARWVVGPGGEAVDMAAPGALCEALRGVLRDDGRRGRLGESAGRHCLEHFGRDRVVDRIVDYYRFVLTHDRATAAGSSAGGRRA